MFIEPNSVIKLYSGIPLDNSYENTLYFANKLSQTEYFHNNNRNLKRTFSQVSYSRINKGVLKVGVSADEIYSCNYLAFQNTSYGSKWFYAFITSVEYLNNDVSQVTFEMDDMQTWLFDVTLKDCLVEREHSLTDVIGEHIQGEPFADLQFKCEHHTFTDFIGRNGWRFAMITTDDPWIWRGEAKPSYSKLAEGRFNNVATGLRCFYDIDTIVHVMDMIREFATDEHVSVEDIVSVFQYPSNFTAGITNDHSVWESLLEVSRPTSIDGYVPRNNKLFTYPYTYLNVTTSTGNTKEFRFEFFDDTTKAEFHIYATVLPDCEVCITPSNYNKGGLHSLQYSLSFRADSSVGFSADSYAQWKVANRYVDAMTGLSVAKQVIDANLSFDNIGLAKQGKNQTSADFSKMQAISKVGQGVSTVTGIAGTMLANKSIHASADKQANISVSQIGTGIMNIAINNVGINTDVITLRKEVAESLDNFFDMFGYACNKLKVPNRSSRPHWNYVKTIVCNVVGEVPTTALNNIINIYNKGITFWKNASEVGNYALNNKPV